MSGKLFVNLPVKDLGASMEFFSRLGFKFEPAFTDDTAACMIVGKDCFVMLLTEAKFKAFTPNPVCDAKKSTEALVCLSAESRAKVDELVRKAIAAGGKTYAKPRDDGSMYEHGFQDLDGHIWEIMFMEPAGVS